MNFTGSSMKMNFLDREMQSYVTFSIKYLLNKAKIGCKLEENYVPFKACFFLSDTEGKWELCQKGS